MPRDDRPTFRVEDAEVFRKNFTGRENQYNRAGSRNFLVRLPNVKDAQALKDQLWNVKGLDKDEEDDRGPFIAVQLGYGTGRPPLVVLVKSNGKREYLNEETVEILDSLDFETVDIECVAHFWDRPNSDRIKAYLKKMYVKVEDGYLDRKWAVDASSGDDD